MSLQYGDLSNFLNVDMVAVQHEFEKFESLQSFDVVFPSGDLHFSIIRDNGYAKLFRRLPILNQPCFLETEIPPARNDKVIKNAQTKNVSGFG